VGFHFFGTGLCLTFAVSNQNNTMTNQEIIQMLIDTKEPLKHLHIFVKMTEDEKHYITDERFRIAMEERKARKNKRCLL